MSDRKRGFLRPGMDTDVERAKVWGLPDYTTETHGQARDTALKYDPGWIPDSERPVEEVPLELTEEEIELIRQGAYQEGLHQGQEAGFKQGYDKGKDEGYQAGHQEGLTAGQTEGLAAGQEIIDEHVASFVSLANQFAQPLALMNAQVERQLVDMVLALVKEVVRVEVQMNPQVILDTVKSSVESLPITGHDITLKLNPEDVEVIRQSYGEEDLDFRHWTLVSEPSLNRGDVEIEAGESSVSYRIEERIRTTLKSFCEANRHGGDAC
ncbi:Flagellar assembly protein FliH [Vibrio ruber DSM 16370]|uniref:Flagellar assembly protein FliH n=1 Tax=Vibrio ruber (strain DSM 16370 / JCM 11486 / BCRC 17186 / CECT 7878 / LMG 23124 / VR1) TaxID=1123498 RepID=A0A1R4LE68_VIBR1|nr:flagellar assembly protein FliH [Vibrio ruber]SJN54842.1 Flagellar assembly protein FliH [Vibrio ruber DSM 16370]